MLHLEQVLSYVLSYGAYILIVAFTLITVGGAAYIGVTMWR